MRVDWEQLARLSRLWWNGRHKDFPEVAWRAYRLSLGLPIDLRWDVGRRQWVRRQ